LLQGIKPSDRARPVAIQALDGHWEVHNDPYHARSLNRPTARFSAGRLAFMRFAGPLSGFYSRSNDSKTRGTADRCRPRPRG
jgi:hypothetical protein